MATKLNQQISSAYLGAASRMKSKGTRQKITAYVESYDDIPFWRSLLNDFETPNLYFEIMLPSSTSLAKGKKMALMSALKEENLGECLIACVDSDYDFLLQGATALSRKIINNPFVFHTYAYAIENYQCFAEQLHEICVQVTMNDKRLIDFPLFFRNYSRIVYPLFVWSVYAYRINQYSKFSITDFCSTICLDHVCVHHTDLCLQGVERRVKKQLARLNHLFPIGRKEVEKLSDELNELGVKQDNCYLFIQGHHIMDNVAMKLLLPVCTILRREREEEIKRLAEHNEQFKNELTAYQRSQIPIELMLKKHTGYHHLFLYRKLQTDIEIFLSKINKKDTK